MTDTLNRDTAPVAKLSDEQTALRLLQKALPYIKYRRDDSPNFIAAHDQMLAEIHEFIVAASQADQPQPLTSSPKLQGFLQQDGDVPPRECS